ncbi:MAG: hypothetical protein ACI9TY_000404 [Alphaproteobacteria bacterium]|jgi:hypothetical protein
MTNKSFNFNKVCIFATILALSGCQGAYKTTSGTPEPVLDMRAAEEKISEMKTISTGGIIMKRTYDPSWEMPKRDVDTLRAEFASLQKELFSMSSSQEQKIEQEFNKVEARVAQMRREEMRQAAKDAELMALVKSKFDIIDQNISFLKASEVQQISEKDALLSVLDDKFQAVDGRLGEINQVGSLQNQIHKEEIGLALQELASLKADKNILIRALDKKFTEVESQTSSLTNNLKGLEYEQEIQKRLVVARKQAMAEAREMRLLEELAIRKEVEEARLGQISAVVQKAETEKKALEVRDYEREKEQAMLELKLANLREKLKVLEVQEAYRLSASDEREKAMKESLEVRLGAIKETYDAQFSTLQRERDNLSMQLSMFNEKSVDALNKQRTELENKMTALAKSQDATSAENKKYKQELEVFRLEKTKIEERLNKADANAVTALQEQRQSLEDTIEQLKIDQEIAEKDAEEYRSAIEERVFAMESNNTFVEEVAIDQGDLRVGRIIESEAQLNNVSITPASKGGVIGGYAQEDWMELEDYQVVLHENNSQLSDILDNMMMRAEPYVGPWQISWKLKEENRDVLKERFSLDVETDFDSFASYISNYMKGYRGFGLTFNIFRAERILVITD